MAVPDPLPERYLLLERYLIEAELAPNSVGRVYRAQDTALQQLVAVNVLAPSLRDEQGIARLRASFRRAFLKRRNEVYDYGEAEGVPFVVVGLASKGAIVDVGQE